MPVKPYLRFYPHPAGLGLHRPPSWDLHETGGIPKNWALDFMAPGGTEVFAPEKCMVTRLSGHNPAEGVVNGDVFGWSIYLTTPGGVVYFGTHFGDRHVTVGQHLQAGHLIANVGHWPRDPGRSHTHLGVTHPMGKYASVARINLVARSPMLPLL